MLFRTFIMVFTLLTTSSAMHAGVWDSIKNVKSLWEIDSGVEEPTIKVLVADRIQGTMVEVRGGYNIYNPKTGSRISTRFLGKQQYMQPLTRGLKWAEEFPGIYQLRLVPDNRETKIFVDGVQYQGVIEIYQVGDRISVINEVDVEDYLKSILMNAFPDDTNEEVMAAVAIAARTEAYYYASRGENAFWHVQACDVGYQGYRGETEGRTADTMINKTKHFAMKRHDTESNERFFAARWTGHCAGKTAPFHVMYRRDMGAPLNGVESPLAAADRAETAWTYSISKRDLAKKFAVDTVSNVEIFSDSFSHKVYNIRLIENEEKSHDVSFFSVQKALGEEAIRGSEFTVSMTDDAVTFMGVGRGAGVGICLYTANSMAQKGKNASQILETFFTDARIVEVTSQL